MTYEQKQELAQKCIENKATLDGHKVFIVGLRLQFAQVTDGKGKMAEYAWPTVERILNTTNKFKS